MDSDTYHWEWCYGRRLNPGWGYNNQLYRQIPIDNQFIDIKEMKLNDREYVIHELSCTDIPFRVSSFFIDTI